MKAYLQCRIHLGLSLAKEHTTYLNDVEEERRELFRLILRGEGSPTVESMKFLLETWLT